MFKKILHFYKLLFKENKIDKLQTFINLFRFQECI